VWAAWEEELGSGYNFSSTKRLKKRKKKEEGGKRGGVGNLYCRANGGHYAISVIKACGNASARMKKKRGGEGKEGRKRHRGIAGRRRCAPFTRVLRVEVCRAKGEEKGEKKGIFKTLENCR